MINEEFQETDGLPIGFFFFYKLRVRLCATSLEVNAAECVMYGYTLD